MAYSKKYYEGLKKSLRDAPIEHKQYWQQLITAYEQLYPMSIKYDDIINQSKKK